jgi:nitroimidazol reductase NimA-like FMN-containing flavoprotein (pyridoxamine 5'-phosphate oxidase superfamily)
MRVKIRRSDRAISESEGLAILEKGEYGILSTVSGDGQPYGIPVSYACKEGAIYFHCAPVGRKLDNLAANNRVSFCVVGRTVLLPEQFGTKYESAIVFGNARELFDDEKSQGLLALIEKYSPEYMEKGRQHIADEAGKTRVFKFDIDGISAKSRK